MLQAQMRFKIIFYSTLFGLFALLNACSNSGQLEEFLSVDPNLRSPTEKTNTENTTAVSDSKNSELDSNNTTEQQDIQLTKLPKEKSDPVADSPAEKQSVADLPEDLPFYPQATLENISSISTREYGVSEWRSQDSINTIVNYYQEKWQDTDWQVIEPFKLDPNTNRQTAIVSRDDLDFTIFLTPSGREATDLKIMYQTADSQIASADDSEKTVISGADNLEKNTEFNNSSEESEDITTSEETNNLDTQTNPDSLDDLAEVPEELRQNVRDVVALNIATPIKDPETNSVTFQPNEPITRREYAKWLVTANNKYYDSSSGNKIRLASKSTNPAFKDIGVDDPDFAEIQGLAEAGLIPSPLTNSSEDILFKPDAPLTREDLVAWKVPLDTRQALPKADVKAIQEAWGFQDANKIDPLALPALFADYQNSDRSNFKRIFGYTTLFQPKKAVTRAEAAASLWYFGYQGDGITARESLNLAQ